MNEKLDSVFNGRKQDNSLVIRQKSESQNGCFKKTKPAKFPKNKHFSPPPLTRTRTCSYEVVRNVCFSENLTCFVFLKYQFWDLLFCLITDDLQLRITVCSNHTIHQSCVKDLLLYCVVMLIWQFLMPLWQHEHTDITK